MGMVPEWGDMMPAISSDGEFVAVATNTGDPDGDLSDNCAGFRLNLRDVEDPMSGASLRWIHVCRLRDDLRCAGEALPVGVEQTPPEASVLPGFVDIAGLAPPSLVYTREWGSSGQARQNDIARVDYGVDHEEPIPLEFGRNAIGAEPIRRTRVGVRRPGRRLIPHQPPSFTGRIAFGECDGFGISQIVVVEADGSNRTVLTEGNAPSWFPSFSPDGTRIAFVREQPTASEIWTMRADGNDLMRLTSSGVSVAPAWSPDGGRIAYSIGGPGRAKKIHIMNADGSGDRRLLESSPTEVDEIAPTWSPDGLEIAFGSNRRGRFEIWVADIDGDDLHRITEAYYDDHLQADIEQKVPAWSPDGSLISHWSGVEADDPRPDLPRRVWVVAPDGTDARPVTPPSRWADDPGWSPDGMLVLHSMIRGSAPAQSAALGAVDLSTGIDHVLFDVISCRPLQASWTDAGMAR
jgi:TolB protein